MAPLSRGDVTSLTQDRALHNCVNVRCVWRSEVQQRSWSFISFKQVTAGKSGRGHDEKRTFCLRGRIQPLAAVHVFIESRVSCDKQYFAMLPACARKNSRYHGSVCTYINHSLFCLSGFFFLFSFVDVYKFPVDTERHQVLSSFLHFPFKI